MIKKLLISIICVLEVNGGCDFARDPTLSKLVQIDHTRISHTLQYIHFCKNKGYLSGKTIESFKKLNDPVFKEGRIYMYESDLKILGLAVSECRKNTITDSREFAI